MQTRLSYPIAAAILLASASPAAAVPTQVSFAGRLADADGPVDRAVDLDFRLYDGLVLVWAESHPGVVADNGLAFVALGSEVALDDSIFTGGALELEIDVDGETMSPRLPIAAVPYATRAGRADRADRADVAGDAERLGGQLPSVFAAAGHDHDGAYLPLGSALTCPADQKVTAVTAAGNLVCAADQDTQYDAAAGGGLDLTANQFGIADGGVTTARIADGAVTGAKLGNGAVGPAAIASGAVGYPKLAADAVHMENIASGAVTRDHIAGLEPALYLKPAGCNDGIAGTVTISGAACLTDSCAPLIYRACGGACNQGGALSCNPTFLGYLIGQ